MRRIVFSAVQKSIVMIRQMNVCIAPKFKQLSKNKGEEVRQKQVLIDTNILVYLTTPQPNFRFVAQETVKQEIREGKKLFVAIQILLEYAKVMVGTKDSLTGKFVKAILQAIRQVWYNMSVIGDNS